MERANISKKIDRISSYKNIKNLLKGKKYQALIKEANKFLILYPKELNIVFMKARALRALKEYEEAIIQLKYILSIEKENVYAIKELFYIYFNLSRYEEALKLLPLIYKTRCIDKSEAYTAEIIIRKNLNNLDESSKKLRKDSYTETQICNYDKGNAFCHILLAHSYKNMNRNSKVKSYFSDDVNISYLFDLVKDSLKDSVKADVDSPVDVYFYYVSGVGTSNGSICNFIKAVTVPNTEDILTIYPVDSLFCKEINDLDCDYDKLFNRKYKVKNLSQIDKFNKRYGRV